MQRTATATISHSYRINKRKVPALGSYYVDVEGGSAWRVIGSLSHSLARHFNCHCTWLEGQIVTDHQYEPAEIDAFITSIRADQPRIYSKLRGLTPDPGWYPDADQIARFVAHALLSDFDQALCQAFEAFAQDIGAAVLEYTYSWRGYGTHGAAYAELLIPAQIVLRQRLARYMSLVPKADPLGVSVVDSFGTTAGVVEEILGTLDDHRERLVYLTHGLSQHRQMHAYLQSAPDDEPVVRITTGRTTYDYAAGALKIVVHPYTYARYDVNADRAADALRADPWRREQLLIMAEAILSHVPYLEMPEVRDE